jgi:RimJ/RimL family protein N-acetyltransferase
MPYLNAPVVPAGSLSRAGQPVLPAADLRLRPWAADDAGALLTAFADPVIQRWHARSVESRQEAVEMIAGYNQGWRDETDAHWAITGPEVLGRVALRLIDLTEGTASLAYWVTPAARGRGTAVRAVVAASAWALDELGLHRLQIQRSVSNDPSCRVAEKAGYTFEGIRRSAVLHPDGWHDMHPHARVQGDDQA